MSPRARRDALVRWMGKHLTRDSILFTVGVAGIIYEIVVDHGERPTLLVLLGAMVGLPAFLRADERRAKSKDKDDQDPDRTEVDR